MNETDAFLQEVRTAPDDSIPRLIYADWLEDNGDPLADLVRVQCELAESSFDDPRRGELQNRERELLRQHYDDIVRPLLKFAPHGLEVRRGFVESIRLNADVLINHADEIVRLLPGLCSLTIRKSLKHLDELVHLPQLAHVKSLCLNGARLGDDGLRRLLNSPHLTGLVELNLRNNDLSISGMRTLAEQPTLSNLRTLDVGLNLLDVPGLTRLRESPHLQQLRELRLSDSLLEENVAAITGPGWDDLTHLSLAGVGLSNLALSALVETSRAYHQLELNRNNLDNSAAKLLDRTEMTSLRSLTIGGNRMTDVGLARLLRSQHLTDLAFLGASAIHDPQSGSRDRFEWKDLTVSPACCDLSANSIGSRMLGRIAASGCLSHTTDLRLQGNRLTDASLRHLLRHTPQLRLLHLTANNLTDEALVNLAKSPAISGLECLRVDFSVITRRGMNAFYRSEHRNPLTRIVVKPPSGNRKSRGELIKSLKLRIGRDSLNLLDLESA